MAIIGPESVEKRVLTLESRSSHSRCSLVWRTSVGSQVYQRPNIEDSSLV